MLKINFVGNFKKDILGDAADEAHICDGLEKVGNKVVRIPRDIWKAYVDGHKPNDDWVLPEKADVNIIVKWHHFGDGCYIKKLKEKTKAPVFYWQFDYMKWPDCPLWHRHMAREADLHLTHELGDFELMRKFDVKPRYFSASIADIKYDRVGEWGGSGKQQGHSVIFVGSHVRVGDRVGWIKEINKTHRVKVWSQSYKAWKEEGIEAYPPLYGEDLAKLIGMSKIVLGFNVNDHCWGYWSNRIARTLCVGGFLLQRYVPGMELFLKDGAEYFSSVKEAIAKIDHYLKNDDERVKIANRGYEIGRNSFTNVAKAKELTILIERYLKCLD